MTKPRLKLGEELQSSFCTRKILSYHDNTDVFFLSNMQSFRRILGVYALSGKLSVLLKEILENMCLTHKQDH